MFVEDIITNVKGVFSIMQAKELEHDVRRVVSLRQYVCAGREPHVAELFEARIASEIIPVSTVPGCAKSPIEKMTCPSSYKSNDEILSPYLISLCATEHMLDVLLAHVGQDQGVRENVRSEIYSNYRTIKKFYFRNAREVYRKVRLGGKYYLEQRPTKPYFSEQTIITPDLTIYRKREGLYRLLMAFASETPGSFISSLALSAILRHAEKVERKEVRRMATGELSNTTTYFCEMVDYLVKFAKSYHFISQSSLESSSDKSVVHFQFVRGTALPIFAWRSEEQEPLSLQWLDWYLPTLLVSLDIHRVVYGKFIRHLQSICVAFSARTSISVTPVFRKDECDFLHMYLILKKNGSAAWNMAQDIVDCAPGWLESCGVFILGSRQAKHFDTVGATSYYKDYGAPDEYVRELSEDIRLLCRTTLKKPAHCTTLMSEVVVIP